MKKERFNPEEIAVLSLLAIAIAACCIAAVEFAQAFVAGLKIMGGF